MHTANGPRVDARSERWRDHRRRVRAQFVDAALRALDEHGPEVSMGDIAKTAGAAKPKLYRHFADKIDLYDAVTDRMAEILWERITSSIDLTHDPAAELVRRAATEYALVVSEHPNVFRFLMHGHFTQRSDDSDRALQSARQSARRAALLLAEAVGGSVSDSEDREIDIDGTELIVFSTFGAVASATDWWIGAHRLHERPMPIEEFVGYLASIIAALAQSSARRNGVDLDPRRPLHAAFSRR
ncbi:TetR family transcriptional regulator [Nocardia mexicana]|uniref:TetR family transcriptional regulator n=2 Tax=Nocardia mexicana TaxID=279262 RepID=A0A370H465_9NOCA|nr:TetR family transcriptional regulator [Nocardia mexicana]